MTENGLLKVLTELLRNLAKGPRSELVSFKRLADKKFKEIEATNKLFIELIERLNKASSTFLQQIKDGRLSKRSINAFAKKIKDVEAKRSGGMIRRRSEFTEAFSFAHDEVNEKGLFKVMPDELRLQLMSFMLAYCSHFIREGRYQHNLESCLHVARVTLNQIQRAENGNDRKLKAPYGIQQVSNLEDITRVYLELSLDRWPAIAEQYFKLDKLFREYGVK